MLDLLINLNSIDPVEAATFPLRVTARTVLFDTDRNVALLRGTKPPLYKLPGGGIDLGETITEGLVRECEEETGCAIRVTAELGTIMEYKNDFHTGKGIRQLTHAFISEVVGEKHPPVFTPQEIEEGFSLLWLPYDEALQKMQSLDLMGDVKFIRARDLAILEAATSTAQE